MRLAHVGHDEVAVGAHADEVQAVLADLVQLRALVDGLLHDDSTPTRWVMARVRVGPFDLSPAVDVRVDTGPGGLLRLVGTPTVGHTPTWLAHHVDLRSRSAGTTIVTDWRVEVDVPGPRVLAASLQPLLASGARSVSRQLADRLVGRFDPA